MTVLSDYQNEAGEWLTSGEAIRAEWAADSDPYANYCDQCGFSHGGPCPDDDDDDDEATHVRVELTFYASDAEYAVLKGETLTPNQVREIVRTHLADATVNDVINHETGEELWY
jgi:hypothetical protein